jgi:hypothetical protein
MEYSSVQLHTQKVHVVNYDHVINLIGIYINYVNELSDINKVEILRKVKQ